MAGLQVGRGALQRVAAERNVRSILFHLSAATARRALAQEPDVEKVNALRYCCRQKFAMLDFDTQLICLCCAGGSGAEDVGALQLQLPIRWGQSSNCG